jgi:hypothetical protein
MDFDYFSIEAILAENQVFQVNFMVKELVADIGILEDPVHVQA